MTPYICSVPYAAEFFEHLRAASVELLEWFSLPTTIGFKTYSEWAHDMPIGVTEHYTAGISWQGPLRWLGDGPHKNKVSCQMLILDRMLPEAKNIYAKYSALKDLEVTTILQSDGIIPAWHAGWVNRLTFGIENRNAGRLRGSEGDWRWWGKGWKAKFPHEELGKTPILLDGQWWEPYTIGQIKANILVCQYLHAFYQREGGLDLRWFLPHSATTGTKSDTGRAFPLQDVRDAVFAQMPIDGIPWLQSYAANPTEYAQEIEEEDDALFLLELESRQAERMHGTLDIHALAEMPSPDLQDLVQDGDWKQELDSVRRALTKLGYVTGGHGPVLDPDTALAVYQFQKSMSCKPYDKIPGSKTQEALYRRLVDF